MTVKGPQKKTQPCEKNALQSVDICWPLGGTAQWAEQRRVYLGTVEQSCFSPWVKKRGLGRALERSCASLSHCWALQDCIIGFCGHTYRRWQRWIGRQICGERARNLLHHPYLLPLILPVPPLWTTRQVSTPTPHSLRSSTTCVCVNPCTGCLLISTIRSPSHRPGQPRGSSTCLTRWPVALSAIVKPKPSTPFTMVRVSSSPWVAPDDAMETLSGGVVPVVGGSEPSRWVSPGCGVSSDCWTLAWSWLGSATKRVVRDR